MSRRDINGRFASDLFTPVVGIHRGDACADTRYHHCGHDLLTSSPGASRTFASPNCEPVLSLLALAHYGDGHERVGGDSPQTTRERREEGGSAFSAGGVAHTQGTLEPRRLYGQMGVLERRPFVCS